MNQIHQKERENPFFLYHEMMYLTKSQVLLLTEGAIQRFIIFSGFLPTRSARCTHAAV